MNARTQLPNAPRSTFPVERLTADQYVERTVDQYRRSCYLSDLTCKRLARLCLMRDLRITYRQACDLLP